MGSGQSAAPIGGFRIFKVSKGSPAEAAGLQVFFDFIVEIAGLKMDSDQKLFFEKIRESENKETKLVVHNIRTHEKRDVWITPRKWGGAGLLGAVFRYDSLQEGDNQGFKVMQVFANSPAETANIIPEKDYLLGTTDVMFRDMDELAETVNICLGKEIQLYIYNSDHEAIREVKITPNLGWGGEGALGADIRTGLLHRIPPPRRTFKQPSPQAEPLQQAPVPTQMPVVQSDAQGSTTSTSVPETLPASQDCPQELAQADATPATTVPAGNPDLAREAQSQPDPSQPGADGGAAANLAAAAALTLQAATADVPPDVPDASDGGAAAPVPPSS